MNSRRQSLNQDVLAGTTFMAAGALFAILGRNLPFGSTFQMGPGYMPRVLSWLVIAVGLGIAAKGMLVGGEKLASWAVRPAVLINSAFFVFAFCIENLGLLVTAVLAMMVAAFAGKEFRLGEQLLLAVFMATACAALFIYGLGLQMRFLPKALYAFISI